MYFIGHTNPDTDSVCAAIACADLYNGTPTIADKINKETEFVLNYFKVSTPELLADISNKEVFLVDHNQTTQAPNGYKNAKIKGILDHHALQNATYTTEQPIEIIMKPWGCSSTIIADLFIKEKKEIKKEIAGVMLSAILSDTLAGQSPTTTEKDLEMIKYLAPIAGISDYLAYAKEMFKAKSNLSSFSPKEILNLDYKEFEMGNKKVGIGVVETVEPETVLAQKDALLNEMKIQKETSKLDFIFFFVVDVLKSHSQSFVLDEDHQKTLETVFGNKTENKILDTGNILSRKKQIVPPLTEYFSK